MQNTINDFRAYNDTIQEDSKTMLVSKNPAFINSQCKSTFEYLYFAGLSFASINHPIEFILPTHRFVTYLQPFKDIPQIPLKVSQEKNMWFRVSCSLQKQQELELINENIWNLSLIASLLWQANQTVNMALGVAGLLKKSFL